MTIKSTTSTGGVRAAGDIDPAFGEGGELVIPSLQDTSFTYTPVSLFDDPLDPQGGFFVYANDGALVSPYHYLVRVLEGGLIDARYGDGGYAHIPGGNYQVPPFRQRISFHQALFDETGAITLIGQAAEVYDTEVIQLTLLVRLKSDGSPDEAFGDHGVKTYNAPETSSVGIGDGEASSLQVDEYFKKRDDNLLGGGPAVMRSGPLKVLDGKITFLANRYTQGASVHVGSYVTRIYATDGRLDESFGDKGQVLITYGAGPSLARVEGRSFTVDSQGAITVAGDLDHQVVLARYRFDGRPDDQFGAEGKVILRPTAGELTNRGLLIGRDQRVAVLSAVFGVDRLQAELVVLRRNGTVDPSFNNGGPFILQLPAPDGFIGTRLNEDQGGRFVVSGFGVEFPDLSTLGTVILRVLPVGMLDNTFGANGLLLNGKHWMILSVLVQPPANLVVSALTMARDSEVQEKLVYRLIG